MKKAVTIDRFALKRDKEMTPGARLDWLAAAVAFARATEKKKGKKRESVREYDPYPSA